jgi:hypothetical protein
LSGSTRFPVWRIPQHGTSRLAIRCLATRQTDRSKILPTVSSCSFFPPK